MTVSEGIRGKVELDDGKLGYGKGKVRLKGVRVHWGGTRKLRGLIEANFLVTDACLGK